MTIIQFIPDILDMVVLMPLVVAHILGDFIFQTDRQVGQRRAMRTSALVRHAAGHGLLALAVLLPFAPAATERGLIWLVTVAIAIAVVHFVIDLVKDRLVNRQRGTGAASDRWRQSNRELAALAVDQALHLLTLLIAVYLLRVIIDPTRLDSALGHGVFLLTDLFIIIAGFLLTVRVGAIVIDIAISPYRDQLATTQADTDSEQSKRKESGFARGGRSIGYLERSLIFLLVLTNHLTAVGFLIAAKSIFRFSEVRDPGQRRQAEYIIIGTLMSFAWAMFAAFLTVWLMQIFNGQSVVWQDAVILPDDWIEEEPILL